MNPTVLGIDTSGTWCSAALVHPAGAAARSMDVGNAHSDHLLAMIDAVLLESGVLLEDCSCIAFGAGPGSFTGLRIACSVAQGLAFGAGLDVAPIGTLDAIAHSVAASDDREERMLVVQDARMGEVYWTLIDGGRGTDGRHAPRLDTPDGLRGALATVPGDRPIAVGCGNAWSVHGAALDGLVTRVVARHAADAVDIAQLGVRAAREGRLIDPANAAPIYVRDRVAETTLERAARKAASLEAS